MGKERHLRCVDNAIITIVLFLALPGAGPGMGFALRLVDDYLCDEPKKKTKKSGGHTYQNI